MTQCQQVELNSAETSLETRVARLEGKLGWRTQELVLLSAHHRIWAYALAILGLIFALVGLGPPNHYYQVVLAAMAVGLTYHRQWLILPAKKLDWALAALNTASIAILFKLVIGSGRVFPLGWLYYPVLQKGAETGEQKWSNLVPEMALNWQPTPAAEWSFDLTIVQTFLLLITLLGATVDFQPFISLTAILLIIVSIPALATFNWDWVFPAIVTIAATLYLQSAAANEK